MKTILLSGMAIFSLICVNAQENKPDTTRLNLGETEVLIIKNQKGTLVIDGNTEPSDSLAPKSSEEEKEETSHDGHWAGVDMGVTMLMNNQFKTSFPNDLQWENDPAKSFYWNINLLDHRFNLYKEHIGITTGCGINFTQIGLRNNLILRENADSLWAVPDSINVYAKNKLRMTYLQIPLLLEFNTSSDEDKTFYFAAGVIGGIRIGSSLKRKNEVKGFESKEVLKGTYGINAFKLDGTVRMGYGQWGAFANYSLIPIFDTKKTAEAQAFSFGLTLNF